MRHVIQELKSKNKPLYYGGLACLFLAAVALLLIMLTNTQVLGINAWIKPLKFYLSTTIFIWSIGYYMTYLDRPKAVAIYSWMVTGVFVFELAYITYQAAVGDLSHFNLSSSFHAAMFSAMGIVITVMTLWTVYIGILFFTRAHQIPQRHVLWGIRCGILLFVVFAMEGLVMGSMMSHTVGAADGGAGLPVTNWSTKHGDLRVAHFFGMHALQIIPAAAYFVFKKSYQVILFALAYFALVSYLLFQALQGIPLLSFH